MCRLRNIALPDYQESVTTVQTDRRQTKCSLCAAMLCNTTRGSSLICVLECIIIENLLCNKEVPLAI